MIRVSVYYPNQPGKTFDFDYYLERHIPFVSRLLDGDLRGVAVEQGLAGPVPGSDPPYLAVAHLDFDSPEAFQQAIGPHMSAIMNDIPNYTNASPVIQLGAVRL